VTPIVAIIMIAHLVCAVGLIVFVLLHSGKGTGLSQMLGGMMPSTGSGTGIIERNLDRITIAFAVGFAATSVLLMIVYRPA